MLGSTEQMLLKSPYIKMQEAGNLNYEYNIYQQIHFFSCFNIGLKQMRSTSNYVNE